MYQHRKLGFTLIELMIVVSIIGILATISVPAYKRYTARAQFSEALRVAETGKKAVIRSTVELGDCPTANYAGGAAPSSIVGNSDSFATNYVAGMRFAGSGVGGYTCYISVKFKPVSSGISDDLADKYLEIYADGILTSPRVVWKCKTTVSAAIVDSSICNPDQQLSAWS